MCGSQRGIELDRLVAAAGALVGPAAAAGSGDNFDRRNDLGPRQRRDYAPFLWIVRRFLVTLMPP